MKRKRCFKCGKRRLITKFYRHKLMADGYLGKCKDCTKNDVRKNRKKNIDYYRAYDKKRDVLPHRVAARDEYQKSEQGKLAQFRATKNYRARNPMRYKAQTAVNNALHAGRLTKAPCVVCGAAKVHGHHEDYSRPLDVIWLCPAHHREIHQTQI